MKFHVIVYSWIVLTRLSSYYADNKIDNNINQQIYITHEEYYNVSKQFYIDNSWNEYLSEVYNEPLPPSSSSSSSLKNTQTLSTPGIHIPSSSTGIHQHDHDHDVDNVIYNKNRIQIYYKNAKIRIKPLNWKKKYLYSTRYGKFDTSPGRYRDGYTSNYIVPSYQWIEVHRFSTHLLYGKDKFEGYSDVSHTTGTYIIYINVMYILM